MKGFLKFALISAPLVIFSVGCAQTPSPNPFRLSGDPFARKLEKVYANIEKEYRPGVRWWLAEGLNTDDTIKKNVQAIAAAGFGAAEILAMPEPGAPDNVYGWGSEEWTADSHLVMEEATKLGLGFSLTSGTHWAHANLPDTYAWKGKPFTPDNQAASKTLDYSTVLLKGGQVFNERLPLPPLPEGVAESMASQGKVTGINEFVFQGVVAVKVLSPRKDSGQNYSYGEGTGTGTLDFDSAIDLTGNASGTGANYSLNWTAPSDGNQYALFTYWMRGSGQTGSPSVSTNYTINYVDKYGTEALIDYWNRNVLTPALETMIRKNGHGELYMDSLELHPAGATGTLWGYDFKQEFKKRAGYDITKFLPFLSIDWGSGWGPKPLDYVPAGGKRLEIEKARNDLYRLLTDMYQENVLGPLQSWLHTKGMKLRAEPSYCYTYEISTPAKYLDDVETETIEFSGEFDLLRGMAGGANMYGRTFSSETGASAMRNYWYDMDYFTQLCYLQYISGVSRIVFHGYSAIEGSDADTRWPGHEGMYPFFSERFSVRQPAWAQYPSWTEMIGRNQKVLQQGQPQRDIAILRTDFNYRAFGQPGSPIPETSVSMNDGGYYWKNMSLQQAGYTYDFFSPRLLEDTSNVNWTGRILQPNGPAYQAVIVYQGSLELSSAKKLLELAQSGVPVIFANNVTETLSDGSGAPLYDVTYPKAAAVSKFLGDSDEELKVVVGRIKALPNVKEIDTQADALKTLQELKVYPRVSYTQPNNKLMTSSRLDKKNGILYVFAYSFKFEVAKGDPAETYQLSLLGAGKPYFIDQWTGRVSEIGSFNVTDGHTEVAVTLKPGQAQIIAINLKDSGTSLHAVSSTADEILLDNGAVSVKAATSGKYSTVLSDGRTISSQVTVPAEIALQKWNIVIEDWNAGDKVANTETKFGHTTTEVYFQTKKTSLNFPNSDLVAWKNLPATAMQLAQLDNTTSMANVSGIGTYTTSFNLPEGWSDANGAVLSIESTGGGRATIYVNDKVAPGPDLRTGTVDITDFLVKGTNNIKVVVSSTLTNRMLQRGYPQGWNGYAGDDPNPPSVRAYGLQGRVKIKPYTVEPLVH